MVEFLKTEVVTAYISVALLFSSGLAATMVITNLLNAGDHIVSMDDVYGG